LQCVKQPVPSDKCCSHMPATRTVLSRGLEPPSRQCFRARTCPREAPPAASRTTACQAPHCATPQVG
jgi:hypothetical protein